MATIPKGMEQVVTTIKGFWKPEKEGEVLHARVEDVVNLVQDDGRDGRFFRVKLLQPVEIVDRDGSIETAEVGETIGVGGASIATFLADHMGQEIALEYTGLGTKKRGSKKQPPRLYRCFAMQ